MNFDPDAVRAFEHAGWQQAAAEYDATFARASAPLPRRCSMRPALAPGCGCSICAAAPGSSPARRRRARRGADRRRFFAGDARRGAPGHPQLRFDEGDAEALPYPDHSFDAVVSNFGIHHIARPDKAIAEALRVLRPGGRFAFTTWAEPADNIAWRLLFDAIRAHGDMQAANAPPSGGNLGTSEAVLRLLQDAGFAGCRAEMVRREWLVAEPRDIVVALARGTVRTAALIAAQPAQARPAIEAAVAEAAAPYRRADGFAVPIVAILASGAKPPG